MIASTSTGVVVLEILIFVVVGVSVIVTGVNQSRAKRQRALDLRDLATRLGFEDFNPNRDDAFTRGWSFLSRLSQGDDRYAFNVLRGTYHEQKLFVFDYHYQTGSGKNTKRHDLTILMLVFKTVFPQITIQPGGENLLTKMAAAFGLEDDIKFESAEFARTYRVQSKDKRFAYDVCNPQMIEYLLANPGLQVEIQGPVILLAFEPQLPVEQVEFNLQRLIEIRTRLPEYLFTNT
jgi:hypothetical protein